jgi:hypothetical protein
VLGWLLGHGSNRVGRTPVEEPDVDRAARPAPAVDHPDASPRSSRAQATAADRAGGAEPDSESSVERWVRLATSVIAPTTVLTALLIYFGYVATTAEYRHFGITLGTLEFSTQDLVLRSIGALYAPLGGLLVALLLGTWVQHTIGRWLAAGAHRRLLRGAAVVLVAGGVAAFARGVYGVVVPEVARTEPIAVSPLSLGLGVTAVAYGRYLLQRTAGEQPDPRRTIWLRRASLAFTAGLITLSLFWATNSFAGAYGRGRAADVAERLQEDRPRVTLDTTERLFVVSADDSLGVVEAPLPAEDGQTFRYRYTGFRLLVEANGRMFLLPDLWEAATGYTLVVRVDDDVRFLVYS